jgi:hypothetical protein
VNKDPKAHKKLKLGKRKGGRKLRPQALMPPMQPGDTLLFKGGEPVRPKQVANDQRSRLKADANPASPTGTPVTPAEQAQRKLAGQKSAMGSKGKTEAPPQAPAPEQPAMADKSAAASEALANGTPLALTSEESALAMTAARKAGLQVAHQGVNSWSMTFTNGDVLLIKVS